MRKKQETSSTKNLIIGIIIILIFGFFLKKCNEPTAEELEQNRLDSIELSSSGGVKGLLEISKLIDDSIAKIPLDIDIKSTLKKLNDDKDPVYGVYYYDFKRLYTKSKGTKYEKMVLKSLDSIIVLKERQNEEIESDRRKSYQDKLRNLFLDNNLDIKVKVYGKRNKTIKLSYVLFNDVWLRKFETEGWLNTIQKEGFTRIEFSDGYNYNKYYTYK